MTVRSEQIETAVTAAVETSPGLGDGGSELKLASAVQSGEVETAGGNDGA